MVTFGDTRLPARFWAKVKIGPPSEYAPELGPCWLWTGAASGEGTYGYFGLDRKAQRAHRVSYQALVGPIAPELVTDHLCRVALCVNPTHLEPVPQAVNFARGNGPAAVRARHAARTHCPQGHPFDAENTYLWAGCRQCRACKRADHLRRQAARRESR